MSRTWVYDNIAFVKKQQYHHSGQKCNASKIHNRVFGLDKFLLLKKNEKGQKKKETDKQKENIHINFTEKVRKLINTQSLFLVINLFKLSWRPSVSKSSKANKIFTAFRTVGKTKWTLLTPGVVIFYFSVGLITQQAMAKYYFHTWCPSIRRQAAAPEQK